MKILFLSPVHPLLSPGAPLPKWQMQASWVRAMKSLGHQVGVVKYTPDDRIRLGRGERWWRNIKVIKEIREFVGGSLIIYSLGADVLLPQTIQYIKLRLNAPLAALSGVSPIKSGNPRERAMAPLVDLAAVNDRKQAEEWLKLGAKRAVVLPIAAIDPELHWPRKIKGLRGDRDRDRDIDVLFVGTMTPERRQFFNRLRKLLPDTVKMAVKEFVWEEECASLLSRAKIAVNPIRPEMKNGANLRLFEIPAFGALQLASHTAPEWFEGGKEIVTYRNLKDAAGRVIYYLSNPKKRRKMVELAGKRVLAEHQFTHRFKKLIEALKND